MVIEPTSRSGPCGPVLSGPGQAPGTAAMAGTTAAAAAGALTAIGGLALAGFGLAAELAWCTTAGDVAAGAGAGTWCTAGLGAAAAVRTGAGSGAATAGLAEAQGLSLGVTGVTAAGTDTAGAGAGTGIPPVATTGWLSDDNADAPTAAAAATVSARLASATERSDVLRRMVPSLLLLFRARWCRASGLWPGPQSLEGPNDDSTGT
jgi:hypothetical protein